MTDGRTLGIAWTPGEVPALLGLTAIAIYGCVPETGQMRAIGVMLAPLFVIELVARRQSGLLVHAVAAGIVLWSGLYGATGRDSAIVGALFAFWPLVLVVIMCHWPGRAQPSPVIRWIIGLIGGIAAVAVARTGALEPTIGPALLAVAIALPVSLVAALLVESFSRTRRRRRG
jgi:hypothetical protein